MSYKADLIAADCPWPFADPLTMSKTKRGAAANYNVLDIDAIKKLNVESLAADDAILALWVPSSLIQDGLDTMKAWGFRFTQTSIWVKTKKDPFKNLPENLKEINWDQFLAFGMGRLFRACHEVALLGVRGKVYQKIINKSIRSVFFAPNLKHSAKPEIFQDNLEKLIGKDCNKLELFARRDRAGWTCVGNQNPSTLNEDIRDSIERLTKL